MSGLLLIYGATGYSGSLIARKAKDAGLQPVLGGRDQAKLEHLAATLCLAHRVARLEDPVSIDRALRDVSVVLHTAGPFSTTWKPMVEACLRSGVHYLDLTGEVPVVEALARCDAAARRRAIMLMPGVGFDVIGGDCLAAHLAKRLPQADQLALGIFGLRFITRGTAKTVVEAANFGVVRHRGSIVRVPLGSLERSFDFGAGPRACLNVSWGDVASAYYTTGIPNIEVYAEATPLLRAVLTSSRRLGWLLASAPWQAWIKAHVDMLSAGPTEADRSAARAVVVGEARDGRGRQALSKLCTPEAYTFTGLTAPVVARRVLAGDLEIGFQTPARVYGADFVLSFEGVSREDLH